MVAATNHNPGQARGRTVPERSEPGATFSARHSCELRRTLISTHPTRGRVFPVAKRSSRHLPIR